jgi:hypothetical protein
LPSHRARDDPQEGRERNLSGAHGAAGAAAAYREHQRERDCGCDQRLKNAHGGAAYVPFPIPHARVDPTIASATLSGMMSHVRHAVDSAHVTDAVTVDSAPGLPPPTIYRDQMEGFATASGYGVERYTRGRQEFDADTRDDLLTIGFGLALGGVLWHSTGALFGGVVAFAWGRWRRR